MAISVTCVPAKALRVHESLSITHNALGKQQKMHANTARNDVECLFSDSEKEIQKRLDGLFFCG